MAIKNVVINSVDKSIYQYSKNPRLSSYFHKEIDFFCHRLNSKGRRMQAPVLFLGFLLLMLFSVGTVFDVLAVGQTVNVWFSSEYNPCNSGWFTHSSWENNITYKLSQQSDITVTSPDGTNVTTINVDPNTKYQQMYGIGTSLEESTVYNLMLMSSNVRDTCLKQLFTIQNNGINMNLARVCIGSSDFTSRTFYTYDVGAADPGLTRFSIQKDIDYNIINVLNQAKNLNSNLKFFGSPWSPPGWMKTSGSLIGGYIDWNSTPVYATYLRKFVQAYADQGIAIDAMTIQNEPLYSPPDYPGCLMTESNEAYLVKQLRSELNNNGYSGVKLWVYDHNFDAASSYVSGIFSDADAQNATEGVACHDYSGDPGAMTTIHNSYPSKSIYLTERTVWGCAGANRIIQYFRNWAKSYNCWVTMLDSNIRPEQWSGTPDPTMIIQSASSRNTYWRTPEFYIMGQFSRYIQRNAYRINSDYGSTGTITNVAFLNPDNTVVMVAVNQTTSNQQFKVLCNGEQFIATLPAKTVGTYRWTPGGSGGSTPTPTPGGTGGNLALNKATTCSSTENSSYPAGAAVDGNTGTRWSSAFSDPQWIYVDLGGSYSINQVRLNWEAAYARSYQIQVSNNASTWNTVWSTTNGAGGVVTINFATTSARYVRMYGTVRGTIYGYSLYEFEVYHSSSGATPTPTPTPTPGSTGSPAIFNNFDTNQGYSAGPNATVTYNSSGHNVILVTSVSGDPGNANQCVKVIPQSGASVNASSYTYFTFWIDDTQGNNTIKVTMVDTGNAVWSGWTSTSSTKNTWVGISLPMSSVSGINKAAIKEIRIGEWNYGTYYIDGLQFNN